MVVEALAEARQLGFRRSKFQGLLAEGKIGKEQVLLVKPLTYMNLSGNCVRGVTEYFRVAHDDLLVISDDVALDLGRLRLRRGGSAGGHNGLESIIKQLGTTDFPRLRVGVGKPPEWMDMMSYVLGVFPRAEMKTVAESVARAVIAAETWLYHGIDEAMNRHNA
jgi:peptidyl-tRNA hydrolase, PTH1 family